MATICGNCGRENDEAATTCRFCGTPLPARPADAGETDAELVAVLATTETGLLPLARVALEQAGIDFVVRNVGISEQIMGRRSSMSVGETDSPLQVLVRPEDEARARDVLREAAQPGMVVDIPTPTPTGADAIATDGPIALTDKETGTLIARISEAQFGSLTEHLEIESVDDDDYYVDRATLVMLQDRGADAAVVERLRVALGSRDGMDIRWSRG